MDVQGYKTCQCGQEVLEITFHMTGRRCWDCFTNKYLKPLEQIEILNRGVRSTFYPATRNAPIVKSKRHPKAYTDRASRVRLTKNAAESAMRRLKNLQPDLYELLYADERVKRGLPPVPNVEAGLFVRLAETIVLPGGYCPATDEESSAA